MICFKLLLCIAAISFCADAKYIRDFKTRKAVPAKTYVINLDERPIDRFLWQYILFYTNVSAYYPASLRQGLTHKAERWNGFAGLVEPEFVELGYNKLAKSLLPNALLKIVNYASNDIGKYVPKPYSEEIEGLHKATGISLYTILLINVLYEGAAHAPGRPGYCTSIITIDKHGDILHGRNLDFGEPEFLKAMTIQLNFQKHGKTLYMGTSFFGYVGLITGTRHGAFSVTVNKRNTGTLLDNIISGIHGSHATPFNIRNMLENATSYSEALTHAMREPTIAPVYYILGGMKPNEGAIVTRNAETLANVTFLGKDMSHPWYILQTNYDQWETPPETDDRRADGVAAMNKVGQDNMDTDTMYEVLSTKRVFNQATIYSVLMSAKDASVYKTMIRYDWED